MMFSANARSLFKDWTDHAQAVLVKLKTLAPYALIELILPGGSLVALLFWLYRQRKAGVRFGSLAARLLSVFKWADAPASSL
jgi:hypothetical protein